MRLDPHLRPLFVVILEDVQHYLRCVAFYNAGQPALIFNPMSSKLRSDISSLIQYFESPELLNQPDQLYMSSYTTRTANATTIASTLVASSTNSDRSRGSLLSDSPQTITNRVYDIQQFYALYAGKIPSWGFTPIVNLRGVVRRLPFVVKE